MNKVKMFFIAAALVLTTAGVFAGKARFASTPANLYYYDNANGNPLGYHQITSSSLNGSSIWEVGTTQGTQVQFTKISGGTAYGVYAYDATNGFQGVYPAF
jgi:hypothetical protein